jgi:hypothetical protein
MTKPRSLHWQRSHALTDNPFNSCNIVNVISECAQINLLKYFFIFLIVRKMEKKRTLGRDSCQIQLNPFLELRVCVTTPENKSLPFRCFPLRKLV